jgi:hypothetical protein
LDRNVARTGASSGASATAAWHCSTASSRSFWSPIAVELRHQGGTEVRAQKRECGVPVLGEVDRPAEQQDSPVQGVRIRVDVAVLGAAELPERRGAVRCGGRVLVEMLGDQRRHVRPTAHPVQGREQVERDHQLRAVLERATRVEPRQQQQPGRLRDLHVVERVRHRAQKVDQLVECLGDEHLIGTAGAIERGQTLAQGGDQV